MKIGILSDTHGILKEEVLTRLKGCEAILHAGDVGDIRILEALKEIAPTYVVKGNNDPIDRGLSEDLEVELVGRKFYMIHDLKTIKKMPQSYDFVISGHSHQFDIHYKSKTTYINPGGCGKRRFGLPLTMVLLDIEQDMQQDMQLELILLNN